MKRYRRIVFMQGDEAAPYVDRVNEVGHLPVLLELTGWDDGEGETFETPPWGTADALYREGPYILSVHSGIPYIGLTIEEDKVISPYIEVVTVNIMMDDSADLSYLGDITISAQESAIREGTAIKLGNGSYFVNCTPVPEIRESLSQLGYSRGVAEEMARAQVIENMKRLIDYHDEKWWCISVSISVEVIFEKNGIKQMVTVDSMGLHGIESDCGEAHLFSVLDDEWQQLAPRLDVVGVAASEIEQSCPSPLWELPHVWGGSRQQNMPKEQNGI